MKMTANERHGEVIGINAKSHNLQKHLLWDDPEQASAGRLLQL